MSPTHVSRRHTRQISNYATHIETCLSGDMTIEKRIEIVASAILKLIGPEKIDDVLRIVKSCGEETFDWLSPSALTMKRCAEEDVLVADVTEILRSASSIYGMETVFFGSLRLLDMKQTKEVQRQEPHQDDQRSIALSEQQPHQEDQRIIALSEQQPTKPKSKVSIMSIGKVIPSPFRASRKAKSPLKGKMKPRYGGSDLNQKLPRKQCVVVNGFGASHVGRGNKYVETTARKESNLNDWKDKPVSTALIGLALVFGKTMPRNFFLNALQTVHIFKDELEYDFETFMGLRCFALAAAETSNNGIVVEYQRSMEGLAQHLDNMESNNDNYLKLSSLVDKLYSVITDPFTSKLYSNVGGEWMVRYPKKVSFMGRVNRCTEYIHLAHVVVRYIFSHVMEGFDPEKFMHKLFETCKRRTSMAYSLYDMICVYPDRSAVKADLGRLTQFSTQPGTFLDDLRSRNQCDVNQMSKDLERKVKQILNESSTSWVNNQSELRQNKRTEVITKCPKMGLGEVGEYIIVSYKICKNWEACCGNKRESQQRNSNFDEFGEDTFEDNITLEDDDEDRIDGMSAQSDKADQEKNDDGCEIDVSDVDEDLEVEVNEDLEVESLYLLDDEPLGLLENNDDPIMAREEEETIAHEEADELQYKSVTPPESVINDKSSQNRRQGSSKRSRVDVLHTFDVPETVDMFATKVSTTEKSKTEEKKAAMSRMLEEKKAMSRKLERVFYRYEEDELNHPFADLPTRFMAAMTMNSDTVTRSDIAGTDMNSREVVNSQVSISTQIAKCNQSMLEGECQRELIGCFQVDKTRSFDDYHSNLDIRFGTLHWPHCTDIDKFNPTLWVSNPTSTTLIRCSVVEVYMMQDLHEKFHGFDAKRLPGDDLGANVLIGSRRTKRISFEGVCVERGHSDILENRLMDVKVDFGRIIKFVLTCKSEPDKERDVRTKSVYSTRIDIGSGGQNFEKKPDMNDIFNRHRPSTSICGRNFFDHYGADGILIRNDIGVLMDALSKTMDDIHVKNIDRFPHKPFGNHHRYGKYGRWLREFLNASYCRFEWITIQLKCLSRGDVTCGHLDTQNDRYPGYNITGGLCFMFIDAYGDYWSLKFIVNSRKKIGDHLIPNFPELYVGMKRQIDAIDVRYRRLMSYRYGGDLREGLPLLTAKNFRSLFLDDDMPWEKKNLRNPDDKKDPIYVETFSMISGIQRDLFMSLILSAIKTVDNVVLQLEFAIMASYLNSWSRFYHVMTEKKPKCYVDLYKEMKNMFGSFKGGTDVRFSASGIDFFKVYIGGTGRKRMDLVVQELIGLFRWINGCKFKEDTGDTKGKTRKIITVEQLQEKIKATLDTLQNDVRIKKGQSLEIQEFRLLFITQLCALGGIFLDEHPILTKLVYVVKGTGGYKFFMERWKQYGKDIKFTLSQSKCIMDSLAFALKIGEADRGNGMECLACESQEGRRDETVRDVFIHGQDLYTLGPNGKRYVKYFNTYYWVLLHNNSEEENRKPLPF